MTERQTLADMIQLGLAAVRRAQRVAALAEERLVRAREEVEEAHVQLLAWTEAVERAQAMYAPLVRPELGVRVESLLRGDDDA